MELIIQLIQQYNTYFLMGIIVLYLLLFILFIINQRKIKTLQKKYNYFMGNTEGVNIEELLTQYLEKVEDTLAGQEVLQQKYSKIEHQLGYCIQKVGIIRYNPFEEMGGNFCFAIALLDEFDNGLVINGILSREGSYTYAKPIKNGESSYPLSAEELQALDQARQHS